MSRINRWSRRPAGPGRLQVQDHDQGAWNTTMD